MKYKLLKDLPWIKAWEIIDNTEWKWSIGWSDKYLVFAKYMNWTTSVLDDYQDFFEPINEREVVYPDNLMNWYTISVWNVGWWYSIPVGNVRSQVESLYIMWHRFPTKEKAEAYIDLKRDVARFGEVKPQTWDKWIGWAIRYNSTQNERYKIDVNCIERNIDFALPLDATEEEKENRVKLLKAYYWF